MEKKSLFSTKTMVATALGAALFFVLFAYVKIPSPIPETNFQLLMVSLHSLDACLVQLLHA